MAYDFTTLSPDDFEALASDLLSRDWGVRLESFRCGKDRGIDLRNARAFAGSGVTVVQCKRYAPENPVGSERIQQFKGAIEETEAWRGYFVTTSRFTTAALDSAELSIKLVLVEMNELVRWHQSSPKF